MEIVIKLGDPGHEHEKKWVLHRSFLSHSSTWFEKDLISAPLGNELARIGEDWPSNQYAERGSRDRFTRNSQTGQRWRYELDFEDLGESGILMLAQRPPPPRPTPYNSDAPPPVRNKPTSSFFRSVGNLSLIPHNNRRPEPPPHSQSATEAAPLSESNAALIKLYDNLFRSFYSEPISLRASSIGDAYNKCKSLLEFAEGYDACKSVGKGVQNYLILYQADLWEHLVKYPSSYLKLGWKSRSKVLFEEALAHVVGRWPRDEGLLRGSEWKGKEEVIDLVLDKVEDINFMIFGEDGITDKLTSLMLRNKRGEPVTMRDNPWEKTAENMWHAWFRQALDVPIPPPKLAPRASRPSSGRTERERERERQLEVQRQEEKRAAMPTKRQQLHRTLRLIGMFPERYLLDEKVKQELKDMPGSCYSRETYKLLLKRMDDMKLKAKRIVSPLVDEQHLKSRDVMVDYLVGARLEEGEAGFEDGR